MFVLNQCLQEHIETLQAEKTKRELLISSQKLEIMQLYDELGLTPQHFQSHASFSQVRFVFFCATNTTSIFYELQKS